MIGDRATIELPGPAASLGISTRLPMQTCTGSLRFSFTDFEGAFIKVR